MKRKNMSAEFIMTCLSTAMIQLMKEKHYNEISITDICKKAGFGRTTYYRYFTNDKEELILYIFHKKWEEAKLREPELFEKEMGQLLMRHAYQYREYLLLLKEQGLETIIVKFFFQEFGRQKDEDEILTYGKSMFVGMYYGIIHQWIMYGCVDTPEEVDRKFREGFMFALSNAEKSR